MFAILVCISISFVIIDGDIGDDNNGDCDDGGDGDGCDEDGDCADDGYHNRPKLWSRCQISFASLLSLQNPIRIIVCTSIILIFLLIANSAGDYRINIGNVIIEGANSDGDCYSDDDDGGDGDGGDGEGYHS